MRADRAVSSLVPLVPRSLSERVGWSVRLARYFSAVATSGPVTVVSYVFFAAPVAVARNPATAASERTSACWAAALSASRCLASAAVAVLVVVGSPVTGSMTVRVPCGTASAASSSPRAAPACWTAVSSEASAWSPEPARGGIFSASSSASAWSSPRASV